MNQQKFNYAIELHQSGDLNKAIDIYFALLATDQLNPYLLFLIGSVYIELALFEQALIFLNRSIELNSNNPISYYNLGLAYQSLQRFDEAISLYQLAIQIEPNYAEAHNNLGVSFSQVKKFTEALESYDRALALRPKDAEVYFNRGVSLVELCRLDEALLNFKKATELRPYYPPAVFNIGALFQELGFTDKAMLSYKKAIELKADYIEPHYKLALTKLLLGEFQEGWSLYEWRWRRDGVKKRPQDKLWLGTETLKNKKLLIWCEQGFGDVIQFCRYVLMAQSLGAKVIFEVPAQLKIILSTLDKNITIVEIGKNLPDFDLQIPIMSLPLAFKTQIDSIPSKTPYLHPNVSTVEEWNKLLGKKIKLRVGLVWSGSVKHERDKGRSIPLAMLEKILDLPVELHSLQIDFRAYDYETLQRSQKIILHKESIKDFSDTAALINNLDLIISIDSSVAHLAGALAKPVWIMLPYSPDFRWMLDRNDSPWYPSARLFRQPKIGDWESVINEVFNELIKLTTFNN